VTTDDVRKLVEIAIASLIDRFVALDIDVRSWGDETRARCST
jgi:hypothetical protein